MKLTKKALALLLALTMVVGLLPAGALAMGVDSKEQIKTTETREFAYADVSADNELSNENAVNTLTTLDGTVTTTETITGTNMENVFKLDLGVTTRDVKETVSVTPDAAVTLVLDMSGSMQSCIVCSMWEGEESVHSEAVRGQVFENWAPNPPYIGSHTFKGIGSTCVECWRDKSLHRHMVGHEFVSTLSQAQDAAISFVSTYSGQMEEGGNLGSTKRMVSLVVFSDYSKSRVVLSWVDAATAEGLQQIKAAIRGVTASGSTYTTRGMELGKDLLHDTTSLVDAKGAPITNKSMVLLTDGEPTLDKGQELTFGGWPDKVTDATLRSKYVKDGQERIEYLAPIGIGMTLKDESIDLYSIYCGNLTENVELDNQSYAGINWMKDFSTAAYSAKDTSELEKAFKAINEEIEIATKAGKVTIPLHKYIVPADVSKLPAGVTYDAGANTLSWALGKVEADENGERDYSTSFNVKLDTAAVGFEEDTYYPTNLYTFLNYTVEQNGGSAAAVQTATFRVPQVKGKIPTGNYTIEFYQTDKNGENAKKVGSDVTGTAAIRTDIPGADYADKFAADGYRFSRAELLDANNTDAEKPGTGTVMTIGTGTNLLKLYYKPAPATVKILQVPVETIADANGDKTYQIVENGTRTTTQTNWSRFDKFSFDTTTANNTIQIGETVYTYVDKIGDYTSDKHTDVELKDSETTITLYYLADTRASVTARIDYVYKTEAWVIKDGKYVLETTTSPVEGKSTNARQYDLLPVDLTADADHAGYLYESVTVSENAKISGNPAVDKAVNVVLGEGANVITVTFIKKAPEVPATRSDVAVIHRYSKNVLTVDENGNVIKDTTAAPEKKVDYNENIYEGETFTVTGDMLILTPAGNTGTYTLKAGQNLSATVGLAGKTTIYVDYEQNKAPETTTAQATHIYRTFHKVEIIETVVIEEAVYDAETGELITPEVTERQVIGTEVVEDMSKRETKVSDPVTGLYVGQSYAPDRVGKTGFTFNETESDAEKLLAADGNAFTYYYDCDTTADDRDAADIKVVHEYVTHVTKIVDGKETTFDTKVSYTDKKAGSLDILVGRAGDEFTPVENPTHGGNEYTPFTTNDLRTVVLQKGTNSDIVLRYERSDDQRGTPRDITVKYYYYDYQMSIKDGNGVYLKDETAVAGDVETLTGKFVDQELTLTDKSGHNNSTYTLQNGSSLKYTVVDGQTEVSVYYEREIPLATAAVTVQHYRVDRTINADGSNSDAEAVLMEAAENNGDVKTGYVGADITINARPAYTFSEFKAPEGVTYTLNEDHSVKMAVPANGATVAYYYIHVVENNYAPASYKINHYYRDVDWNQNAEDVAYGLPETFTYTDGHYATEKVLGVPNLKLEGAAEGDPAYKLDKATATPNFNKTVADRYEITLAAGDGNVINFYYTKRIDTRVTTTVVVNHNYFVYDAYTKRTTGEGTPVSETFNTVESGAYVGNGFQAMLRATDGEGAAAKSYEFRDAVTGETTLVLAESKDRLVAVELSETATIITINYLRRVDTTPTQPPVDPPSDNYYRVTVEYRDLDGKTLADSYQTASIREGGSYDVTAQAAKAISGYAIDRVEGATQGRLSGNVTVTVFYASESTIVDPVPPTTDKPGEDLTDIPEVDVPTTDLPGMPPITDETVIVDENVPMGNLPQTGAVAQNVNVAMTLGALALSASLAAAGLGVALRRKKEEEV